MIKQGHICILSLQAADIQNCMYHPKEDIGGTYLCCKRKKQHFRSLMANNGCTHRAHKTEDEKIQEYMEFIGVERNFKVGPIGPVWKEPEEGKVKISRKRVTFPISVQQSPWQSSKSKRWNLDNIR